MAGVSVKMGVEGIADFKRHMKDAESAVSTLDAALKLNEQQFKSTGDEALYLENQSALLQRQIEKQTDVVQQAQAALDAMRRNGVDENSKSFQDMQGKVYTAWMKLDDMRQTLNKVQSGAEGAADGLGDTDSALTNIEKNGAWENVSKGLHDITSKLQSAGRAAISFGKRMYRSVQESAQWADQLKTDALKYGMSVEELQKMQHVADMVDTETEAIITARQRLMRTAAGDGGKKTIEEALGISLNGQSAEDLFWETGDAIMNMGDQMQQEAVAAKLFGRSWHDLIPLFTVGREGYEAMLDSDKDILSEEDVNKLGEVNDALDEVNRKVETIKNQFVADNADKILGLLQFFLDNYEAIIVGIGAVGGAIELLKLGETAVDIGKIVNAMGILKGGNGGTPSAPSIPTGNGTPAATSAVISNGGKGWDVLMKGTAAMLLYPTLEKLFTEGVPPAYGTAGDNALDLIGGDGTADLLKKVQNPGGYTVRDVVLGGEPSQVQKNLDAIADWQFGDDMTAEEAMALVSASEGTKEATERMATLAEETNENSKNNLKSQDVQDFKNLPGAVEQAVLNGMSGATVVIDRGAIDTIGGLVGQNLWTQLMGQLH